MKLNYNLCSRCIMDTSAANIKFNKNNICNFCNDFEIKFKPNLKKNLEKIINKIKKENKNNEYDCAVALSGGVDSSWALIKVVEMGMRPLVIHLDNGWNSKLAQTNIYNLVSKLNLDLETYIIDWEEYRNLMDSFFKANVIDIELLMDNAMVGANFKLANKYSLKYIISGFNETTEGINIPKNWNWFKKDKKNIKNINKRFNNYKIKSFPAIGTLDYIFYRFIKKIKWISPLNYLDYNKENALKELKQKYDFQEYPFKHYESIFTRFYQGYILPKKFNVDKRKLHLSNLIITNQITRDEALKIIKQPAYDLKNIHNDIEYFLKKMEWSKVKFDKYLKEKEIPHRYYGSEIKLWNVFAFLFKYYNYIKKID